MNIVVTGASGLLGRAVYCHLKGQGYHVVGTCYSRNSDPTLQRFDLMNASECVRLVRELQPSILIHCAAERRPDIVENQPEECRKLNVTATQVLAECCAQQPHCVMISISTDYVFDGKHPPYAETAQPNPLNAYGVSKWESEKVVLQHKRNAVFRVPILYGQVEYLDESAVTVLFGKVKDTSVNCVMSNYERRYPTHTLDVARGLELFLKSLAEAIAADGNREEELNDEYAGIFHLSAPEEMTKYDMAVAMAEAFQLTKSHIQPDNTASGGAQRPYNAQLSCERLQKLGAWPDKFIPFHEGIRDALKLYAS